MKSAELAGVKQPKRYNYCVNPRDYIIKSCDFQLRNLKSLWRKINAIMATGRNHKSMAEVRDKVLQDRDTSGLRTEPPQRRALVALTHRPLNANYNPITPQ